MHMDLMDCGRGREQKERVTQVTAMQVRMWADQSMPAMEREGVEVRATTSRGLAVGQNNAEGRAAVALTPKSTKQARASRLRKAEPKCRVTPDRTTHLCVFCPHPGCIQPL